MFSHLVLLMVLPATKGSWRIYSGADCASKKSPTHAKHAPLVCMVASSEVFERAAVYIVGPFVKSQSGNMYLLVVTDYLTRYAEVFAIPDQESTKIATILVDKVIFKYGIMNSLLSDRGQNFLSKVVRGTCKYLSIKKLNTTSFHPQTNGLVDRLNKTLVEMLSMLHYLLITPQKMAVPGTANFI